MIDHLDEIDDADRFASLIIYADGGRDALPSARTIVCPGDEEGTFACPLDSTLDEVLTVQLAREAIEVWSLWRGGKSPNREEKLAAVMFYSQNDAYLPLEDEPR